MTDLKSKLYELGFSEKEANVYLGMLELGPASVLDIAKKAGVNRATTYVMLESLKRRGLMSSVERGKKIYFAAETPKRLLSIVGEELHGIEEKKKRVESVMPQFLALYNAVNEKPHVRYFEGEEGIIAAREAVMELAGTARSSMRAFVHYDAAMVKHAAYNEEQRHKLARKMLNARIIFSIDDGLPIPKQEKNIELRQVKPSQAFQGEFDIYDTFVLLAASKTRPIAVIVESVDIAKLAQAMFDMTWNVLK